MDRSVGRTLAGDVDWEAKEYGSEFDTDARRYDETGRPLEYLAWDASNSRVVSGPIGRFKFPGRSFPDRPAAREYWKSRASVVEEYLLPGRWAFRIRRTK